MSPSAPREYSSLGTWAGPSDEPENANPMTREVRIEDLREPRRTADEQAFYEFALRMEVDLASTASLPTRRAQRG